MDLKQAISEGKTALGIELGSTRIKAVLIDGNHKPVASGSYDWENKLEDGIWTYELADAWKGLQGSFQALCEDVRNTYGTELTTVGSIGISGMMHGYLPFDKEGKQLAPFRTWRNTITGQAAEELSELFYFHVPQRWSISHLYQAILNGEEHVSQLTYLTTLAGYIHWQLTGEKVMGVGEASGMFPIDVNTKTYDAGMTEKFNRLAASKGYQWKVEEVLPKVLTAGEAAGRLTEAGARLLDPSGRLQAGIPLCPPEGDADTGMVATNSVEKRTGNISAGTSFFAMVVLEKELKKVHEELDIFMTPEGNLTAQVHGNNGTSDLNGWVGLFGEAIESFGVKVDKGELYSKLYHKALEGDPDCGGLLAYNYFAGEHLTGFEEGRQLFARRADSSFNLANFMRVHLSTSLGALRTGLHILFEEEGVQVDEILGHGGFFKTKGVGQRIMAGAMNVPVTVMETAGEGGAWGIALLASYMKEKEEGESLSAFLSEKVFAGEKGSRMEPNEEDVAGFNVFMERYTRGLAIERAAVENL